MAIPTLFDEHDTPRMTRGVQTLLAINVAVMLLQWSVVSESDAIALLGFQAGDMPRALWSSLTYLFVHFSLWHLALNMYALVAFGPRLERAMGTRSFVLYYLWCGLGGVVAHLLFVPDGMLLGASAGVLGVMYGYAQQWPDEEVAMFGVVPMRAWTMAMLCAAANIALGVAGVDESTAPGERVAYLAHLGGIAFGWLYLRTPPATSIERLRQRVAAAPDYHDEAPRAVPRNLPRARAPRDEVDEVVAKSKALAARKRPARRATVTPVRTTQELRRAELDRVLDKISSEGLDSLTGDERAVLDAMARRLRGEA